MTPKGPLDPQTIAQWSQGQCLLAPEGPAQIHAVAPLNRSRRADLSYIKGRRHLDDLRAASPGVLILRPSLNDYLSTDDNLDWTSIHRVLCSDPEASLAVVLERWYTPAEPLWSQEIHPTAVVHPDAKLGEHCTILPGATIGPGVILGHRVTVSAGASLGAGVVVGDHSWIGPGARIDYSLVGSEVRIQAGACLGNRGMGFTTAEDGNMTDVPQLGRVVVHDGVEIGANTTIDRGKFDDTVIGSGCRIDNQVQIAHNVQLGKNCVILSLTSLSGSVVFEDRVICGGNVGIAGHLRVGHGARILGGSMLTRDVPPGTQMAMTPAVPIFEARRLIKFLSHVGRTGNPPEKKQHYQP